MKKRCIFVLILIMLLWIQNASTFNQDESIICKEIELPIEKQVIMPSIRQFENVAIDTLVNTLKTIEPTPEPTQLIASISSAVVKLETIQDYINACPEGYTQYEIELLAKVIWGEGRGESDECQIAIGQVVLNRSRLWEDTIEQTIFRKGQFTVASSKRKFMKIKPTIKEYRNAFEVMSGEKVISDEALYFHSTSLGKKHWAAVHHYEKTIDHTSFYKQ